MSVNASAHKRHFSYLWIVGIIVVLLLFISGAIFLWARTNNSPLPSSIQRQLSFSPLIVAHPSNNTTVYSYKYDSSKGLLSFILRFDGNSSFTISEQSSPPDFDEVPNTYTQFLNDLNQFSTVETANGPLNLTRPKNSFVAGVIKEQGVLLFIRPSTTVSDTDWRRVVEMLTLDKIS